MTGWTRVVIWPDENATVADVDDAVAAACDDPETEAAGDRLVWKEAWSFDVERIRGLDLPAEYVLVAKTEDTAGTGSWYLFEPHDGELVLSDAMVGGEHRYGEDADDVLRLEHGIEEVPR